jgi:hypothetical protein
VRGVGGVKRVVRVFEYITEDDLRAMQPKRSDSQSVDLNAPKPSATTQPVVTPIK